MLSTNNILKPSDGRPVVSPTQDMVIGTYYLTSVKEEGKGKGKVFGSSDEVIMAYSTGDLGLHVPIKMKVVREIDGKKVSKLIDATAGRVIFNEAIPQDLGFKDRTDPDEMFELEIDQVVDKKVLGQIVDRCYRKYGATETSVILDKIKELGFRHSTKGAITVSVSDMVVPEEKKELLKEADQKVLSIERQYRRGLISDEERYDGYKHLNETTEKVTKALMDSMDHFNPIYDGQIRRQR